MEKQTSNRLDQYLEAFGQRLKKLTLLQGIAATAVVLLVVAVIGAWFSTESGFSSDTVAVFRIFLVLALAAVIITRIISPLRDIDGNLSHQVEARTPDFGGRIETYAQMKETNNPFRDLLAEDTMRVGDSHPVEEEISQRDFSIAGAVGGLATAILLVLLVAGPGMINYSLRNLLAGWAFDDLLPPQSLDITPGNQSVRRGANLRIMAMPEGFNADEAIIHVREAGGDWQDVEMVQSPAGFEFTFFAMQKNMSYYVSTTGLRSPQYEITVVDVPGIERLELTYHYPEWTERDPEIFTLGDVRTLPDTRIEVKVTTTAPLTAGELVLNDNGQAMIINGADATSEFTVTEEGEYYIAAIVGGERVRLSDDYFIRLAEDDKPVISFIRPGGDWNASNIEEVTARIEASDDFNLERLTLKYSVNGGDWESVELASHVRDVTAEHIFMLEDMRTPEEVVTASNLGQFTIVTSEEAQQQAIEEDSEAYLALMEGDDSQPPAPNGVPLVPGDLISFYAEGADRTQTVRTDMFFIQIQNFQRRYSQSQLSGGGGGGGQQGGPQDEISNRQRQIITSTWNLIREQAEDADDGQVRVNSSLLSELQTTLAEQAATLAQRTRARQLDNQDEQIEQFVTNMEEAVQNMYPASERLAAVELEDAIGPAQEALQHLLRAEAVFNEFQVTNQQGGGGGGGGRAQQDLAEMFELEMDLELNQYETGSNASPQAQQAEEEDIMKQLDELARRQQQLANNLRNQQQLSEAQRYQQEMLRRQTEELQERLEQLQQQRQQLSRGQGQQSQQTAQNQPGDPSQEQNQSGQPGQPGQSSSGQGGEQSGEPNEQVAQSELQRRLESAVRAMNQSAEAMRDGASPEELQRAAEEAQRQLEGARDQIAADQLADLQSSFSNMADQAERMLREQQRQEQVLQDAMAKAVAERESGEDANSRGMELQEEWELAREKTQLAADLSSLQEQMLSAMQRFGDDVPEASRELQRANQEIVENELEQALSNAALYIDAGYGLYIAGNESAVTAEMRKLAQSLAEAQELVEGQGAPGTSDLDIARRQAQALRQQLQQQLAGNGQPSSQQQGDPNQQGQEGQQGQPDPNGQQQGQQQGGQQQGGNQAGGNFGGGDRQFAGNRFGPWNGVDPQNRGPIDIDPRFYGDLDQFTERARDAVQDLELNAEELAQMYDWIRQLEATRLNRNDDILAAEYNDMLALIEQLEVGLQIDNAGGPGNNVRTATSETISDEYKESVAEYYRRLSRE
jgi:hypothetical protein